MISNYSQGNFKSCAHVTAASAYRISHLCCSVAVEGQSVGLRSHSYMNVGVPTHRRSQSISAAAAAAAQHATPKAAYSREQMDE